MIDLLEGMRVVELASYIMGPIAGRVLAEWGAEVIKIEPMLRDTWNPADGDGDMIRGAGMARAIVNGDPCVWEFVNGNKKSVCIDTRSRDGYKTLIDLCLSADVVILHIRPSDAKKLKVDYESLSKKKPDIIVASASGYGNEGPDAERGGFDAVAFAARSGMINALSPSGEPAIPYYGMGDVTSGTYLASAIIAAYAKKLRTGRGEEISVSLYGSAIWTAGIPVMTSYYGDPYPTPRSAQLPTANPFRCADGKWIYLMGNVWVNVLDELMKIMDLPADAKQRWPSYPEAMKCKAEILSILDEQFARYPRNYWLDKLSTTRIPYDVLADFSDIQNDEQAWAAGYLVPNAVDKYDVGVPAFPAKFRNAGTADLTMNYPGEHTVEQLRAIGYSDEKISALIDKAVISQLDPETYEYERFNITKPGTTYNIIMGGNAM